MGYPRAREVMQWEAQRMINNRTFISVNGNKPLGVRGELYDALKLMLQMAHEIRDMQIELDKLKESDG